MKKTEQFTKIFGNMRVERAKAWHVTIPKVTHRDKKKEANKKACRKGVMI
jgi:hypothetical protein